MKRLKFPLNEANAYLSWNISKNGGRETSHKKKKLERTTSLPVNYAWVLLSLHSRNSR